MVIFSKVIYEYMLEKFPCRQIAEVRACNGNIPVWTLPYEEETIAFYLTPIGSALAQERLPKSIIYRSIRLYHVWLVRQSGQRSNRWKVYSPNGGIPGRRTVLLFCRTAGLHKNKKHGQTGGIFQRKETAYVQGRVWTTDSMLRETVNLVRKRKEEGCLAVEMELAAFRRSVIFMDLNCMIFLLREMC